MNRVVFLQGNPATEQHGVTFLWLGSAQHVAHGLFRGLFGAAQFRVPSIKRDPRLSILFSLNMVIFNKQNFQCYFRVSKCPSYSDHHRAVSPGTKQTFPVSLYGHCLRLQPCVSVRSRASFSSINYFDIGMLPQDPSASIHRPCTY